MKFDLESMSLRFHPNSACVVAPDPVNFQALVPVRRIPHKM